MRDRARGRPLIRPTQVPCCCEELLLELAAPDRCSLRAARDGRDVRLDPAEGAVFLSACGCACAPPLHTRLSLSPSPVRSGRRRRRHARRASRRGGGGANATASGLVPERTRGHVRSHRARRLGLHVARSGARPAVCFSAPSLPSDDQLWVSAGAEGGRVACSPHRNRAATFRLELATAPVLIQARTPARPPP